MQENQPARFVGRGATVNPPNRFETTHREADYEHLLEDDELFADDRKVATQFLPDNSQTIIRENNSPDIPFRYSINPYRGCEHGCAYCYARPGHETLGMNAGIDFETKILVKHDAARLLRKELNKPSWQPEAITISGVTDCYQPAERRFRLTRSILEVMLEARQPVVIITKNALPVRDLDLLVPLAERKLVAVGISVTTLDAELARTLEPRTATPAARLRAIRELSSRGVPVRVMMAPIIPGLTDHEIPKLLATVKEAGARGANFTLLRLPWAVAPIFMNWLQTHYPLKAARVEGLLRGAREGKLYQATFGERMRGSGAYASEIEQTFALFKRKLGLDEPWQPLDTSQFQAPRLPGGQLRLF